LSDDKRTYEGSTEIWHTAGVAIAFTIVGIISIICTILRIPFIGLRFWGYWLFIPAFFLWISTISIYIKNKRLKQIVMGVINSYGGSIKKISLENLSSETLISKSNLLRILIDLRSEGKIKYLYDRNTGDILLGENSIDKIVTKEVSIVQDSKIYCPYCGVSISKKDKFCFKCGSSLE